MVGVLDVEFCMVVVWCLRRGEEGEWGGSMSREEWFGGLFERLWGIDFGRV